MPYVKPAPLRVDHTNDSLTHDEHPAHHNGLAGALRVLADVLGSGPQGPDADVTARLARYGALIDSLTAKTNQLAGSFRVYSGQGAPATSLGKNGDLYFDTVVPAFYGPKAANAWPAPVSMHGADGGIGQQGPQGPPGPPGPPGSGGGSGGVEVGQGIPSASTGNTGDVYFDNRRDANDDPTKSILRFYGPKTAAGWPVTFTTILPQVAGANTTNSSSGTYSTIKTNYPLAVPNFIGDPWFQPELDVSNLLGNGAQTFYASSQGGGGADPHGTKLVGFNPVTQGSASTSDLPGHTSIEGSAPTLVMALNLSGSVPVAIGNDQALYVFNTSSTGTPGWNLITSTGGDTVALPFDRNSLYFNSAPRPGNFQGCRPLSHAGLPGPPPGVFFMTDHRAGAAGSKDYRIAVLRDGQTPGSLDFQSAALNWVSLLEANGYPADTNNAAAEYLASVAGAAGGYVWAVVARVVSTGEQTQVAIVVRPADLTSPWRMIDATASENIYGMDVDATGRLWVLHDQGFIRTYTPGGIAASPFGQAPFPANGQPHHPVGFGGLYVVPGDANTPVRRLYVPGVSQQADGTQLLEHYVINPTNGANSYTTSTYVPTANSQLVAAGVVDGTNATQANAFAEVNSFRTGSGLSNPMVDGITVT